MKQSTKHIIKLGASPKNIIQNWKVDDPFLKFFIYTYEPLIDLQRIKNQNDLIIYIKNELIPSLEQKIDINNKKGYYKQTLSDEEIRHEFEENIHNPVIQSARNIYKRDPNAAKKTILQAINSDKQKSFKRWWDYMSKDYRDNPAFFYSILNPIIESSPSAQKNGPPPAHREAVSLIKDEIETKGVNQMNIFKKFTKTSFSLDKETSEFIDIDKDRSWIRVDSKIRDQSNFTSNQEKLMRFATDSGWCIGQEGMSNTYLSKGDFWLYFEHKRPKVAIRLLKDKKVEEIRGLYNKQDALDPYWEPVTSFLHQTDFDYQGNSFYKRLQDIMFKNIDLEQNPEAYKSLLLSIEKDPTQIGQVSKENKRKFPELVKTAAKGYEKRMHILLDAVQKIPPTGNEYQNRFGKFQDEYQDIPDEVKPYLSNEIEGRLVSVHKGAFLRNPLEYEFFPDEIKRHISEEEKELAWKIYVGNDPYRYNDTRIPEHIRKKIDIKVIKRSWEHLIDININHIDNIPSFIRKTFPKGYIENKIIEDFKRYPCSRDSYGYDKLRRIQEMNLLSEEKISIAYLDAVRRNPNIFNYVPPQYKQFVKDNLEDISPIAKKYLSLINSDANYYKTINDQNIKNYLLNNHQDIVIRSFVRMKDKYGKDLHGYWKSIPEEVQQLMPEYIKEEISNFYIPYVQQNPEILDSLSYTIKPYVIKKMASFKNWFKKAISHKYNYFLLKN